ncbi:RDD family protein [Calidifontibacter terrae]
MASPTAPEPIRRLRGADDDRLVTGEAVLIDVPATSVGSLILSALIDLLVQLGLLLGAALGAVKTSRYLTSAQGDIVALLIFVGVLFAFPVAVETLTRGRSLGKMALKLRVVRDDGGPIVFRHALVRGLVGIIEKYMFYAVPAVISSLLSTRAKRLGDFAAGTYVVREETALRLSLPPQMPYPLAGWAASADIAPLPDGMALQIRQFLGRSGGLTPAARQEMGNRLLAQVLSRVSPAPPNAPVEAILAAVVAERRRRDLERLQREAQTRSALLR